MTSMDVCRKVAELVRPLGYSPDAPQACLDSPTAAEVYSGQTHAGSYAGKRSEKGKRKSGVGHGGTLDPAATGVLVLGVGEGTKRLRHFLSGRKQYRAVVRLGVTTDTLDSEGRVVEEREWKHVTKATLTRVLRSFLGKQLQQPPLFSAKRVNGVRMYDIVRSIQEQQARQSRRPGSRADLSLSGGPDRGDLAPLLETPNADDPAAEPRPQAEDPASTHSDRRFSSALWHGVLERVPLPRPCEIEISQLDLVDESEFGMPYFAISVTCSKGTYIRQLAADIAARCGTVGHLAELTRTSQAPFRLEDCVEFEGLTRDRLLRHLIPIPVIDNIIREKERWHRGADCPN
ncbi:putative tRNA pseudouridine synthase B [Besnoitia besnoiti]|uniref:tRNA pseudouridine(55) synthase n=1 Tax=Besnoitia besnoiti TaxID=94643 RepID=A0A2A9MA27_BESBE|nr:putative tRNA pseudouridine synthase B [Besnoitia besnoiti]PFH32533.1 putative tRNA pseudouridine synthase B [Besnoitia besnoiti]